MTLSLMSKLGIGLLALAMIVGSVGILMDKGAQINEAKHQKANAAAQTHVLETALEVAKDFAKLGSDIVEKVTNVRVETQQVVQTQVKYVHDHPLPTSCALDDSIVQLRDSQIRHIYEIGGDQLPSQSQGKGDAGTADDKPPAGRDRRTRR